MQQPPDWATEEYIAVRQSFRVFTELCKARPLPENRKQLIAKGKFFKNITRTAKTNDMNEKSNELLKAQVSNAKQYWIPKDNVPAKYSDITVPKFKRILMFNAHTKQLLWSR